MARAGVIALAWALAATPAWAHDYWLFPDAFDPPLRHNARIMLFVGDGLQLEQSRPHEPERTARLELRVGGQVRDLSTTEPDPATRLLQLRFEQPGQSLLVLDREPAVVSLDDAAFDAYLAEEGHTAARALRQTDRRPTERERFHRHLKALFTVGGDGSGATYDDVVGQTLELVLHDDPTTLTDGLDVEVRFRGAPLAGTRVQALQRLGRAAELVVREGTTDGTGRVHLGVDRPGMWLVRTVTIERCADCGDADWQSWWAAYSFEAGAAP